MTAVTMIAVRVPAEIVGDRLALVAASAVVVATSAAAVVAFEVGHADRAGRADRPDQGVHARIGAIAPLEAARAHRD